MEKLTRVNAFISKHLPWLVLSCVALGMAFADTLAPLNAHTVPIFAFITFTNSLGGDFHDLAKVARHPLPVVTIFLLLHVVMPLITLGVGRVLFPDAPLFALGLLLEYSIPTAISSLMWTGVAGGSMSLTLAMVMLDTILAPFVVPFSLRVFAGSVVEMDAMGMMKDLLFMVALPAVLAMALHQKTYGKVKTTLKPVLDPFSKIMLLTIIAINATGCAPYLKALDRTRVMVIVAVFLLCLLGFFLGYLSGRLMKKSYATTFSMALTTGSRNISAGAVLAAQYFPPDVMFPVAFTPIFLQFTTSIIVKILMRGKEKKDWGSGS